MTRHTLHPTHVVIRTIRHDRWIVTLQDVTVHRITALTSTQYRVPCDTANICRSVVVNCGTDRASADVCVVGDCVIDSDAFRPQGRTQAASCGGGNTRSGDIKPNCTWATVVYNALPAIVWAVLRISVHHRAHARKHQDYATSVSHRVWVLRKVQSKYNLMVLEVRIIVIIRTENEDELDSKYTALDVENAHHYLYVFFFASSASSLYMHESDARVCLHVCSAHILIKLWVLDVT